MFGNFLNGSPEQKAARSSSVKRPSDSPLSQTSKRPRTDNGPSTADIISLDGTSDTLEMDRSADSGVKRKMGHQGSQSLRSSDNRHTSGAIDEYRSTNAHSGLRAVSKRSRHHKKGPTLANGGTEQESDRATPHETIAQPPFRAPGRRLLSRSEHTNDRIEDDELEMTSAGAKSGMASGRGNSMYRTSVFAPIEPSSDDELNEVAPPRPKTKMRDRMNDSARSNDRRGSHTNNGLKRPAESPDVLQDERSAKRRHEPSSESNIPRTKFSSSRPRSARGCSDEFRVKKAVCEPTFIYPAAADMLECADAASDAPCWLLPKEQDSHHFKITDDGGTELEALGWIAPNLQRVQFIYHHSESPIVKFTSSSGIDSESKFTKGAAMLVEFDSVQEAKGCVTLCRRAQGTSIRFRETESVFHVHEDLLFADLPFRHLRAQLDEKIKQIRERNVTKDSRLAPDMQLAARQVDAGKRTKQRSIDPALSEARQKGHFPQTKALRMRMRAEGDSGSIASPDLTKSTRNVYLWEPEDDDNEQVQLHSRNSQESQRNLRSVKSKVRSPTPPPPERWTDKNPNWVNERNYNVPLIYERTTINATDIERLDEGQFLNDEIISFYAKYLHKNLEARNEQVAKKVYVFSSFFWEKLRSSGYDGVEKWTAKVDMSSFDYIIVPINQSAHWYLAIICNPGGLLPKSDTGQDRDAAHSIPAEQEDKNEVSVESEAGTKLENVTTSLAGISFDERNLDGPVTIELEGSQVTSSAKKSKSTRKGPGPRKYPPKDPRVIVLDSLDGAHTNVATTLKNYLKREIKQRKNVDIELPQQFGMAAKDIPFQTNFTDCGVYLLGYLEEFMKDPHEFTKKILQHENRTWDVNASAMRNKIRELIFDLQNEYQKRLKRQKREKMLASKQIKAKSQTPPAVSQAPSPRLASEQRVQAPSVTTSSNANARQRSPVHVLSSTTRQVEANGTFDQRGPTVSPPLLQQEQAGSTKAKANLGQVVHSSQSPERDLKAADVHDSMIGKSDQSEESIDSAPLQQEQIRSSQSMTQTSPVLETGSSSDGGSEILNANASMIVHPDRSMESKEAESAQREQIRSSQALVKPRQVIESSPLSASRFEAANVDTAGQHIKSVKKPGRSPAEHDLTPRSPTPIISVEIVEQIEPKLPGSSEPPRLQGTSRLSEQPTMLDGNFDERSFLMPIRSSSPSSPPPVLSPATSNPASAERSDRNGVLYLKTSARHAASRKKGELSHYWPSRGPSTTKAPVRRDESPQHTVVESSSMDRKTMTRGKTTSREEGKRSKRAFGEKMGSPKIKGQGDDKGGRQSPTIDLTTD